MNKPLTAGLYVHVPFCRQKCPYCAFYSIPSLSLIPQWLDAIQSEILLYRGQFPSLDSLYLGGGTPTLLSHRQWPVLMESLYKHFIFLPGTEVTVEANPDDITRDLMQLLSSLGVNRISLGIQSFNDGELQFLKRRHTSRRAFEALHCIRSSGFNNLGIDLMYGLPGQTEDHWLATMERAFEFTPEHISCYQFTIEPKTPFAEMRDEGTIKPMEEDQEKTFFVLTSTFFEEKGYLHYEISNYARREKYTSRHNMKYWQHVPYLGLGPSAHSFHGSERWWNLRSVEGYCRALAKEKAPVAGNEVLSEEQHYMESLMLGLRTMYGIDLKILRNRPQAEKLLSDLEGAGLVKIEGGRIIPTREGFLVADSFPLLFSI